MRYKDEAVARDFIRQAVLDIETELERMPTDYERIKLKGLDLAEWAKFVLESPEWHEDEKKRGAARCSTST